MHNEQTLWLLMSTTLLALTVPGVALFYGGMVRKKNIMNTIALPFVALAAVSFAWCLVGNGWSVWNGAGRTTPDPAPLLSLLRNDPPRATRLWTPGSIGSLLSFSVGPGGSLCGILT